MDAAVTSAALHLLAGKYFQVAAAAMFAYDHLITVGQEVERVWMRPKSAVSLLFFFNRYATLMQFIIILVVGEVSSMYLYTNGSTIASLENCFRCDKYVLFEGVSTVGVVAGLRTGFALPLRPGFIGCILTGSDSLSPSLWIAPLVTDSFIFLLTIYRTKENIGHLITSIMNGGASDRVVTILLRDGLMYYFLIFLANLMNCLIYFIAEPDLKTIGASFSQLLTCTMISRLVLNLRSLSDGNSGHTTDITAIQFNGQRDPLDQYGTTASTQPETQVNNPITLEIGHSAFDEAPLEQVERISDLNDKTGHSLHDV
ncbi:hypothetical protein AGABI1DRAFT_129200 [Agaricus bisporus var. burnettii JB137-S8]|uniref:DUF6533 domain-containing protein n=1 Tax=Agaricus bisporus var. burnettii (strain JB137-S8 / ATCC MYA-4627 / FGSC 10392) TaxID=597362 RepID=K5VWS8_AGABU|nr:uncharacterized protein AGABI1DRAFT_129200 [Agaricus bisporus var. burnettii JB137-S8]EKM78929.1 hypothetical protein AGABI1DRAFT_129200 [Agaricus bisporus var. burnettii JB137-S8]